MQSGMGHPGQCFVAPRQMISHTVASGTTITNVTRVGPIRPNPATITKGKKRADTTNQVHMLTLRVVLMSKDVAGGEEE